MTPEEIREKYGHDEPLIGHVKEIRVSPERLRVARRVPDDLVHEDKRWVSMYFMDMVGLTISLLSDADVEGWTVLEVKD